MSLRVAFFIATQVMYTIGFVFMLVASIGVLATQLCFVIDKEILAMRVLSFLMFMSGWLPSRERVLVTHLSHSTAFFTTIAIIIFGIRGDDRDWMPDHEHNFLSWSFGLAVVGTFFAWLSTTLFWAESRILYKKELKSQRQMFNMESTSVKH